MSLKHAILGFLSFQPFTGYDLKKAFDQSVAHFWPANQSQIYRTLSGLTDDGLIAVEEVPREDRLSLKVYSITSDGQQALRDWLCAVQPLQGVREPFLIQLYFGGLVGDDDLLPSIQDKIDALNEQMQLLEAIYRDGLERYQQHDNPRAVFYGLLTLEYGITSNRAALDWLHQVAQRVRAGEHTPLTLFPASGTA